MTFPLLLTKPGGEGFIGEGRGAAANGYVKDMSQLKWTMLCFRVEEFIRSFREKNHATSDKTDAHSLSRIPAISQKDMNMEMNYSKQWRVEASENSPAGPLFMSGPFAEEEITRTRMIDTSMSGCTLCSHNMVACG
jgi:hypothetical protein